MALSWRCWRRSGTNAAYTEGHAEHSGQRRSRRCPRDTPPPGGSGRYVPPGVPPPSPRRRRPHTHPRRGPRPRQRACGRTGALGEGGQGGSVRSRRPLIVVDASVIVTALADDGADGDRARGRLRDERLIAPHLIDLEVVSAWRRLAAAGDLDERRAQLALGDLRALRIERVPHRTLLGRCWELRDNLTVYDAAYVALAELLNVTLLTADARLAGTPGPSCEIELMRP
jgi:predicted nucleic acid-binding protein